MRLAIILLFTISFFVLNSCNENNKEINTSVPSIDSSTFEEPKVKFDPAKIVIEKALIYDNHTLDDTYPYKDTVRTFQWDKIRERLALADSIGTIKATWAILQNYKNKNSEAPLVRNYQRNSYKRVSDSLGVERYQSVPLYLLTDSVTPDLYGRDGSLVKLISEGENFAKIATINFEGEWFVPKKYIKVLPNTVAFKKAIFVDRTNQNIVTMEKADSVWLVRSMNPATTGLHKPPHMQETPVGVFVIQEKKPRMVFLVDGSTATGGFAPYASRFTNGAYLHGVPVNVPNKNIVEFSPSLGTTPRSHMCVRNATSHAKFIYDWAPAEQTLVFVFD